MKKQTTRWTAALCALAIVLAGCSGNDTITLPDNNDNGAPALPSVSTMKFELDFFGATAPELDGQSLVTGKPSAAMLESAAAANRSNWINAFVRALYAQLVTFDALEEPIAAFALAIHSVPQALEDGRYLWTYIYVDKETGVEYSIFLYGLPVGNSVEWTMEVSSNDPAQPLDHFKWFDGTSVETEGYWQFYEPIDETNGVEVARVDWTDTRALDRLLITVNGVGHENEGDTLEFTETHTEGMIEHYDASEGARCTVRWFADGTGSITCPDYNGGEKACWDEHQRDTVCPE